jgi:hypothetical protein
MVELVDKYWHPRGRGFSRFDLSRQLLMEESLRAIVGPTILL